MKGYRQFGCALDLRTRLDGASGWHKDPVDRIPIAQAKAEGLVLITSDGPIGEYPIQTLW